MATTQNVDLCNISKTEHTHTRTRACAHTHAHSQIVVDNQRCFARGSGEASAAEKVKCVCLYTSFDSGISRGGVISPPRPLCKSVAEVDLCIMTLNPFPSSKSCIDQQDAANTAPAVCFIDLPVSARTLPLMYPSAKEPVESVWGRTGQGQSSEGVTFKQNLGCCCVKQAVCHCPKANGSPCQSWPGLRIKTAQLATEPLQRRCWYSEVEIKSHFS